VVLERFVVDVVGIRTHGGPNLGVHAQPARGRVFHAHVAQLPTWLTHRGRVISVYAQD
jgi:hypothetical protein